MAMFPALERIAAPANRHAVGTLYGAATLTDLEAPARIEGGVRIEQVNCSGDEGTVDLDCPPGEDDDPRWDLGERAGALEFEAFGVWARDECGLVGSDEDEAERAIQRLRITEERLVSRRFADTLLERAESGDGGALGDVLADVEELLGETGMTGVIHASRRLLPEGVKNGWVKCGSNGRLESPGGHTWAFGTGYRALGGAIVATGPVTIFRTPVETVPSVDHRQNRRGALAEREVLPTYECVAVSYSVGGA